MDPLKDALRKVQSFRRDLSAKIVIEEEQGHYEKQIVRSGLRPGMGTGRTMGAYYDQDPIEDSYDHTEENVWVVDKLAVTEPDIEKREAARSRLKEIYDSSGWFAARYAAGEALGFDNERLKEQVVLWIEALERELNATESFYYTPDYQDYKKVGDPGQDWGMPQITEIDSGHMTTPDIAKRMKAINDAIELFRSTRDYSLKEIFRSAYSSNSIKQVRRKAGETLGYSSFRIWFHELVR